MFSTFVLKFGLRLQSKALVLVKDKDWKILLSVTLTVHEKRKQ